MSYEEFLSWVPSICFLRIGNPLRSSISRQRLLAVDRRGTAGDLLVRLVPLPGICRLHPSHRPKVRCDRTRVAEYHPFPRPRAELEPLLWHHPVPAGSAAGSYDYLIFRRPSEEGPVRGATRRLQLRFLSLVDIERRS